MTDGNGAFRVVSLPPGSYEVEFRLEGFQDLDQKGVQVNIAQATPLRVQMASGFTGEIAVTAEHSGVNTTTTESGVNLTSEFFINLPTGRDYASVARVTPGAQSDASGQTFYGSTGAENAYYVDGVNTTGIERGQQGKELDFEFIDEVQVKSAGYDAEYGRNTGGIISVITKAGGNAFHGDVFGYYDSDSLRANLKRDALAGAVTGVFNQIGNTRQDYGADVGGYFIKDKLWFFAAYDWVDDNLQIETTKDLTQVYGPVKGAHFNRDTTSDLFAGKITWLLNPRHTISASVFGDPSTINGPVNAPAGPPTSYLGRIESGATDYAVSYDGVLTDKLLVTARYASHDEKHKSGGPGEHLVSYEDFTDPLGDGTIVAGWNGIDPSQVGLGRYSNRDRSRDTYHADASYFVKNFGGAHEFKLGAELEDLKVRNATSLSGGQQISRFCYGPGPPCPNGPYFFLHFYRTTTKIDNPDAATRADIENPVVEAIKATDEAYFFQDTWRATSNFTLDLGVRWDVQNLYRGDGNVQKKLDDAIAPRVGFIWDPINNGRSKIYAHYGQFYETVPMNVAESSFGSGSGVFARNFSSDPADVAGDPLLGSSAFGASFENVDPSTRSQHIEEWVVGGEYGMTQNVALGLKYISRDLKDIMEDALTGSGRYYIGNPGRGLMTGTYDIGYAFGYNDVLHHLAVPTRKFKGVELTVTKRPTKNFQFLSSLLWSKLDGTYDGLYQVATGQLNPNLSAAFDFYDFSVNSTGKLSNDRTWQFKWDGTYQFDFGLTIGLSAHYESGVPITALGYASVYGYWLYYLSTRGAFGRTDSTYEASLHLGYPIKLSHGVDLNLLVDIFNLLNRQGETGRDMRYTNPSETFVRNPSWVPYYEPLNWFTGQIYTLSPQNPQVKATNAGWNTSNAWQDPRSVRLGVRLSW